MNKAVTSFINTSESAQIALIKASHRGSMYMPQSHDESTAIAHYWASAQRIQDGRDALFTTKIQLPFDDGVSYVINKQVIEYIRLLFIGQGDTTPFLSANYDEYGSDELKAILAGTAEGEEVELEGAIKCEALGHSIKYGRINPVSDSIELSSANPMEGSITFRVGAGKPAELTTA